MSIIRSISNTTYCFIYLYRQDIVSYTRKDTRTIYRWIPSQYPMSSADLGELSTKLYHAGGVSFAQLSRITFRPEISCYWWNVPLTEIST